MRCHRLLPEALQRASICFSCACQPGAVVLCSRTQGRTDAFSWFFDTSYRYGGPSQTTTMQSGTTSAMATTLRSDKT